MSFNGINKPLTCDMVAECADPVTHIDEKGYGYCASHGKDRRESGIRCRKLTGPELRQLRAGQPLASYERRKGV